MYQASEEYIPLKSSLNRTTKMSKPWHPKQIYSRGQKIENCNVTQAIYVDATKMKHIVRGDITAIIFDGIQHFKAQHAIIYTDDKHIDIDIKQVRHTTRADIQKHEMIKSGLDEFQSSVMCYDPINYRGHVMNPQGQDEPVTFVEWVKR